MPHCQAMGKHEYIGPQVHAGDEGKGENRLYSTYWTHKSSSCDKLGLIIIDANESLFCSICVFELTQHYLQFKNGDNYLAETV